MNYFNADKYDESYENKTQTPVNFDKSIIFT